MVSLNRDGLTQKVLAGERISADDALELYRWPLEELGALAHARRDLAKAKSYGGGGRELGGYIGDHQHDHKDDCHRDWQVCARDRTGGAAGHHGLILDQAGTKSD